MYNEPDKASPYGMERPAAAKPYDQDKEKKTPSAPPSAPYDYQKEGYIGAIDNTVDSSRRAVPNTKKTMTTRRYEAQQEYGKRKSMSGILARKRGQNTNLPGRKDDSGEPPAPSMSY